MDLSVELQTQNQLPLGAAEGQSRGYCLIL